MSPAKQQSEFYDYQNFMTSEIYDRGDNSKMSEKNTKETGNVFIKSMFAFLIGTFSLLLFYTSSVFAVPACPFPTDVTQANGSVITITGHGDEFFNWSEDKDGYVIAYDSTSKNWEYAVVKDGSLQPGGEAVTPSSALSNLSGSAGQTSGRIRSDALQPLIQQAVSTKPDYTQNASNPLKNLSGSAVAISQNQKILLVLLEFDNVTLANNDVYWYKQYFSLASTDKSVVNYYKDQSGGLNIFAPADTTTPISSTLSRTETVSTSSYNVKYSNIVVDVNKSTQPGVVKVHLHMAHPNPTWTDMNNCAAKIQGAMALALKAIQDAYPSFNFSDTNLHIAGVIAGGEASCGYSPGGQTWAHAWSFFVPVLGALNGAKYMVQGEMYSSAYLMGIGVSCHELGHTLGLLDLYDTTTINSAGDYASSGIGPLSLSSNVSAYVAFDNTLFEWVSYDGQKSLSDNGLSLGVNKFSNLSNNNMSYTLSPWTEMIYGAASADSKTAYISFQAFTFGSAAYTDFTTLQAIRLALRPGKSFADMTAGSVRLITAAERDALAVSEIALLSDGTTAYIYGNKNGADTLAEPTDDVQLPNNPTYAQAFPDPNFRALVLNWIGGGRTDTSPVTDADKTAMAGWINMDVSSRSIADLTGIEYFTGLLALNCRSNQLTSLDVSKNTALEELTCFSNQLTSLDVSHNTALTTLSCSNNQLTSLDATHNTALTTLDCHINQLASLGLPQSTALTMLDCDFNKLTSFDVSHNTALKTLICNSNQLTSLDVSHNTALQYLDCSFNQLTSLIVPQSTALTWLNCSHNQLTSLNVSNCTSLTTLDLFMNKLTSLNVSNCTSLTTLYCDSSQLTSLDLSNCTSLTTLYCDLSQLTSLDLSNCTSLTMLYCESNQLTSLDVSDCTALTTLNCSSNQLTSLDVSHNTALTSLVCDSNQLTLLDLTHNTALYSFSCYDNQLTSLDVSHNTALTTLYCYSNQLTSLDVSHNTALHFLYCYDNYIASPDSVIGWRNYFPDPPGKCGDPAASPQFLFYLQNQAGKPTYSQVFPDPGFRWCVLNLIGGGRTSTSTVTDADKAAMAGLTNLNVSGYGIADLTGIEYFTGLTSLNCGGNQLTSLDVSKYTALTSLNCGGNQLTSLDLSHNTALTSLDCGGNKLTSLDVSKNTSLSALDCHNNYMASPDSVIGWRNYFTDPPGTYSPPPPLTNSGSLSLQNGLTNFIFYPQNASPTTYTITYDTMYDTGGPAPQTVAAGSQVTIPSTVPTLQGYTFLGWSTSSTAATASYQPGDILTPASSMTLYAVWKQIVGSGPTISISNVRGRPGETVTVSVSLENNPGITGLKLGINYDSSILHLDNATSVWNGMTYTPPQNLSAIPFNASWISNTYLNNDYSGTILNLQFTILSGAVGGTYPIKLTYDPYNTFDENAKPIVLKIVEGSVEVFTYVYGDADGNGMVTNYDAILILRYVNGWDMTPYNFNTLAADVDGNGMITNFDAILILRYVNGWFDKFPVESANAASLSATAPSVQTYMATDASAGQPTISVISPSDPVNPGDTVNVQVNLENNPGITGLRLGIDYNSSALKLNSVTSVWNGMTYTPPQNLSVIPYNASWISNTYLNNYSNGTILNLQFTVLPDAAGGTYPITLTYDPNNTFDEKGISIVPILVNGSVTVKPITYTVTVGPMLNGTVAPDKTEAAAGDTVTLIVTPGEGYMLTPGSLMYNDTPVDFGGSNYSFKMPAENVTITAAFQSIPNREPTPNASIDYSAEQLTGLVAGSYSFNGGAAVTVGTTYGIPSSWLGTTLSIVKLGNGTTTDDSLPQNLAIPARPTAPNVTAIQPASIGGTGGIGGTTTAMEYRTGTGAWINCTAGSTTGLAPAMYQVRVKATSGAFASDAAAVTINAFDSGVVPAESVKITAPASTVKKGTTIRLTAEVAPAGADQSVIWSSSSDTVATVDQNGVVTAIKTGTVRITATTSNGRTYMTLLMVTA